MDSLPNGNTRKQKKSAEEKILCSCNRCHGRLRSKKTWRLHNKDQRTRDLEQAQSITLSAETAHFRAPLQASVSYNQASGSTSLNTQPASGSFQVNDEAQDQLEASLKRMQAEQDLSSERPAKRTCTDDPLEICPPFQDVDMLSEHGEPEVGDDWNGPDGHVEGQLPEPQLQPVENELPPQPVGNGNPEVEEIDGEQEILRDLMQQMHLRQHLATTSEAEDGEGIQSGLGPGESDPTEQDRPAPEATAHIEHLKFSQEFLDSVRSATLEDDNLDAATRERLMNPGMPLTDEELEGYRLSLDLYFMCSSAPESVYKSVRELFMRETGQEILSLHRVRGILERITGIAPVYDDMCISGCFAYTGPFKDRTECNVCGQSRYLPRKPSSKKAPVARQQACTIPLGPQIQALRQSRQGSLAMQYRSKKMQEIFDAKKQGLGTVYDDIFSGTDMQNLGDIIGVAPPTEDDTLVGLSIDGAQLYQDKQSDTWFGIWIVYDYDPVTRYKRRHILPAFIVPGPEKPKNMESYLYRSFYHLSALQNANNGAGLKCYDALKNAIILSRIFFVLGTADAPGLVELDGRVGHHGARGCRLGCPMKGRHKHTGHYYAAHLCPNQYFVDECNHPDFDIRKVPVPTVEKYREDLQAVMRSQNQTAYERERKRTGISRPSLISALKYALPPPKCFTVDLMHLFFINIPELFLSLWRGTMRCEEPDSKENWPWRTFTGKAFEAHGELVAAATKHFPSSFHRPPRNPAKKLNSGFKATEYCLYFYGLGPALFRRLLPFEYWQHYCLLVRAVRILMQRRITHAQMLEAHSLVVQFVEGFEHLYYQRMVSRMHFCRPCLHTLLHTPKEIYRAGPGTYGTQYTLEGSIGTMTGEIRQHSTPFANITQIAVRMAQANALKAMYPQFDHSPSSKTSALPAYSLDGGGGTSLHTPRSDCAEAVQSLAQAALIQRTFGLDIVRKWGRAKLASGQVARSRYGEDRITRRNLRRATMTKIKSNGHITFGEVQFFFCHESVGYAMVSVWSSPNAKLLKDSLQTISARTHLGDTSLAIVKTTDIISSVAMQELPRLQGDPENLWYPVEKTGLDDIRAIHPDEDAEDDDNDDNDNDILDL